MKPRILLSAYSLAPRQGSEPGIGWAAAMTLSKIGNVEALVGTHYEHQFEAADRHVLLGNGVRVHFRRLPGWQWIRRLKPAGAWSNLYYSLWQKAAGEWLRAIAGGDHATSAVHFTWAKAAVPFGAAFSGHPYGIGPVGGLDPGLPALDGLLARDQRAFEVLRRRLILRALTSERLAKAYRNADFVFANTDESRRRIEGISGRRVDMMTNCGVDDAILLQQRAVAHRPTEEGMQILFAGRLLGWKGEVLALHALAQLRDLRWRFTVAGDGPGRAHFEGQARKLGIAARVNLRGKLSQRETLAAMSEADVFLFPSYHDSGGTAVLEAMGAALPVVCLNAGGPGLYVDSSCGFAIEPGTEQETIEHIGQALRELHERPELRRSLGENARSRCAREFTWTARANRLVPVVSSLVQKAASAPVNA